eukprot:TRINITY_DN15627_c0_g1_i1.p1 TRINITY_DN15627_c0_g1~~TRINITY_DN15627_c0_g1_i1.p1  ORF type:complete len:606 (+),score=137.56 TRINITY_DN15627_c0_g1_i1:174-1991(+)
MWTRPPASGLFPSPRGAHSSTLIESKMFVFGGFDGSKLLNDLYVYSSDSMRWSKAVVTGSVPSARGGHTATPVGPLLVLFGGGSPHSLTDVHVLDTERMEWSAPVVSGDVPAPRTRHSAAVCGSKIFVMGGGADSKVYDDVYALDTAGFAWTRLHASGDIPSARWGHTATCVGDHIYIFGGHDGHAMLNDLYRFDTGSCIWTRVSMQGPIPSPRAAHTSSLLMDYLVVFGGGNGDKTGNDLHFLNLHTMEWIEFHSTQVVSPAAGTLPAPSSSAIKLDMGNPPQARCAHTATEVNNQHMIVFGGGGGDGTRYFRDLCVLDMEKVLSRLEEARRAGNKVKSKNADKTPAANNVRVSRDNDIRSWLTTLNLSKYAPNFAKEEIGMDVLPMLNETMLVEDLQIPTVGARLKILKAIRELTASSAPGSTMGSPLLSASIPPWSNIPALFADPSPSPSPLSSSSSAYFSLQHISSSHGHPAMSPVDTLSSLKSTLDYLVSATSQLSSAITHLNNSHTSIPLPYPQPKSAPSSTVNSPRRNSNTIHPSSSLSTSHSASSSASSSRTTSPTKPPPPSPSPPNVPNKKPASPVLGASALPPPPASWPAFPQNS